MATSIPDFWKLLVNSRLLTVQQCQQLSGAFGKAVGTVDPADAKPLAKWLVKQNLISRYQAGILLRGRSGPFHYGDYKLYDRLEKGPLAGSFRAVHTATNHPVLLRFASPLLLQDAPRWATLSELLPRLLHPHLVRCWDAVHLGKHAFFVYEDLRGRTLAEQVAADGRIPPAEAARILRCAALGLSMVHQMGRPHGDVRPSTIWLDANGFVKLMVDGEIDLGPADLAPHAVDTLSARADYLAPELAVNDRAPDPLSDIYALGSTLFESLAGEPPFGEGTVEDKLRQHASQAIAPPEGVPQPMVQVVTYMMAKNPQIRLAQAAIVAEQLAPFLDVSANSIEPVRVPPTQSRYEAMVQERRAATAATAAAERPEAEPAAERPQIQIQIGSAGAGPSVVAARRRRAGWKQKLLMAVSSLLVVAMLGAVLFVGMSLVGEDDEVAVQEPPPSTSNERPEDVEEAENAASGIELIEDDGESLWASPTSGEPFNLDLVPAGAQMFLVARGRAMTGSEEGQRVLRSLGPEFVRVRASWEAAAGFGLDEMERVVVACYGNMGMFPRIACVVTLAEEQSAESLLERWNDPEPRQAGELQYHAGPQWSYLIPPVAQDGGSGASNDARPGVRTFVMGHEKEIADLAESELAPPLLRRQIGKLLRVSDDERHLTILLPPPFLFGDGRALFSGTREKVLGPLQELLGDGVQAAMLQCHLAENHFHLELRLDSDVADGHALAGDVRDRLAKVPDRVESYILRLNPHTYWDSVALRYPIMVGFLHEQTRIGVDGSHAVLNAVLPLNAAHNLVIGGELTMSTTPGAVMVAAEEEPAGPKTIEEILEAKVSISFDQDSLEFSMQNVEKDVQSRYRAPWFRIRILGDDLRLNGITRNQQIRDFEQIDKTVAEVLTALVMKANPVTTVEEPSEPDQKLLWVIGPNPDNAAEKIILITTRDAAEERYTLPPVFQSPDSSR